MQCLRNWLVSYSASQPCGHRELRNSSPKARIEQCIFNQRNRVALSKELQSSFAVDKETLPWFGYTIVRYFYQGGCQSFLTFAMLGYLTAEQLADSYKHAPGLKDVLKLVQHHLSCNFLKVIILVSEARANTNSLEKVFSPTPSPCTRACLTTTIRENTTKFATQSNTSGAKYNKLAISSNMLNGKRATGPFSRSISKPPSF